MQMKIQLPNGTKHTFNSVTDAVTFAHRIGDECHLLADGQKIFVPSPQTGGTETQKRNYTLMTAANIANKNGLPL